MPSGANRLDVTFETNDLERLRLQRAAGQHLCDAAARGKVYTVWISLLVALFLLIAGRVAVVDWMRRSLGRTQAEDLWAAGFAAVCVVAVFVLATRTIPAIMAKSVGRLSPPATYRLAVDDQGLRWESPHIRYAADWPAVSKVFTTPEAVCFLIGEAVWYVPKRAFGGPNGVDTFLSFVLPRVTKAAKAGPA